MAATCPVFPLIKGTVSSSIENATIDRVGISALAPAATNDIFLESHRSSPERFGLTSTSPMK
jgi:hypothetical protein